MSNIKDDTINAPRLTITTKGNGCPGCGFPKLACRCGGASGDAETNSEDNSPLAAQNESANKGNDGAKTNNRFSIPNPYALPKCTPS
jgi:hypothetical protein